MWDCASQLWVPGRSLVHGRPYLSFCPITLQHFNYRSWCRWMPIWKRSRLVPLFSWWGHRKGGFGGGWGGRGSQLKYHTCLSKFYFLVPPGLVITFSTVHCAHKSWATASPYPGLQLQSAPFRSSWCLQGPSAQASGWSKTAKVMASEGRDDVGKRLRPIFCYLTHYSCAWVLEMNAMCTCGGAQRDWNN
jgi:hypothetical protein